MICQMCNKAEATVHLTQVVGGKSKKLDLCSDCAEQCGVDDPAGFSMIEILKKFSGVFGPEEPATQVAVRQPSLRCPVCGYTELDMSKTGRVGCPSCYITFEKGLEKALKTMHRGTRHVGKHPQHMPLDGPPMPEAEKPADADKPPVRKRARSAAQKKTTAAKEAEVAKTEQTQKTVQEELKLLQGLLKSKEGVLEEAIEVENYEYAARIRDEIKELKVQLEKLSQSEEKEKMMTLSEFLIPSSEYAARRGPEDVIVLSSRARLARNLCDSSFPSWAKKPERLQILKRISDAVVNLAPMKSCLMESMDNLSNNDKLALMERHLISREHTGRGAGSGLAINKEENISVMINEEDHLRMQAILPGFQIRKVWERIDQLDSELEKKIPYAFHPEYGYLTACPTNLGTGIRVSAMLHLPGLALTDQISQIVGAVSKLGLAVRGIYGEGTDALGNLFQASNQMTLGETEEEIVIRLEKVIRQVVKNEENARQTLLEEKDQITLLNHIGRAWGILSNCYTIETRETLNLLSFIRLGIDLGMFPKGKRSDLEELFLITQRGHLQLAAKENMDAPQRDRARAEILRKKILKLKAPQKVKLKTLES